MESRREIFIKLVVLSCVIIVLLLGSKLSHAQRIIYDQTDIWNNYFNDCYKDNINLFPSIVCKEDIEGTFNVLPIYFNSLYNTRYAKSINDGPAWGGRGLNNTIGFGFSGKKGRLTYVINPIIYYSENRSFYIGSELTSSPEFQNPYYNERIDYVSRYGDEPLLGVHPGQSEISFDLNKFEVALSSQNMRWGPGLYNPVLMSTNAPGIPHFRVGTNNPLNTKIGEVEASIFWGLLRESDYFNNDSADDWRYFTAINLGYRPSFFEGFSMGINRIFYTQTRYLTGFFYDASRTISTGFIDETREQQVSGRITNDVYDQILSLTLDWEDEETDLRIYMEIFRGDFASGIAPLLEQPEHNQGFMAGFIKGFELSRESEKIWFTFEHSALATWETSFLSAGPTVFTHDTNRQGYTNNGQIIGSAIGPGSQGNAVTLSYQKKNHFIMIEYQRSRYNDDYFYTTFMDKGGPSPQDIEHQVGLKFNGRYSNIEYTISSSYANRDNYLFDDLTVLHNVHSYLTLRYYFR